MCGFIGYIGKDKKDLRECSKIISHRGPDKTSIEQNENFSVAFNRLSIIDTSDNGMQPFKLSDVVVYFNGEIYNYLELQKKFQKNFFPKGKSDGEILPFLFKKFGINFLNELNGMFSMVIIDQKLKKAFFIRDRFAEKPLYYVLKNNVFYFTSEIKALEPLLELEANYENININFNSLFLPQGLSLFKNINSVNPSSYIELNYLDNLSFKEVKWYEPSIQIKNSSKNKIFEQIDSYLKNSIKIRTRSDVPIGIYLSGGLDSTCIASYYKNYIDKKILSFTAISEDKYLLEKNDTDLIISKNFAKKLEIENFQVDLNFEYFDKNILSILGNFEELLLDTSSLMKYGLAKKAKEKGVKVILAGSGGDELFGGYPWQKQTRYLPNSLLNFSLNLKRNFSSLFRNELIVKNRKVYKLFQLLLTPKIWHAESLADGLFSNFLKNQEKYLNNIHKITENIYKKNLKSFSSDINNNINFLNIFYTLGSSLYGFDMASMSNSIENRSPLLDRKLLELSMSIPDQAKNINGSKSLFREFLSWKKIPDYVVKAKKSGPSINLYKWIKILNTNNNFNYFLDKNKNILEYSFHTKINFLNLINSKNLNDKFILFGFLNYILWHKLHIEKKNINLNFKLSDVWLDL